MEDIKKLFKALERMKIKQSKGETLKNETQERKWVFIPILLGTLLSSLLGSVLTGTGVIRAGA